MEDNIKMHLEEVGCMGLWRINSPQDMNEWFGCCENGNEALGSIKCREFLAGNVNFSATAPCHSISYIIWQTWLRPRSCPSWEASSRPVIQLIPLLWYNHSPLLVPILSHICPIYKLPFYTVMYILILSTHILSGLSNATTCFSCSPPDFNVSLLVISFLYLYTC
jgi:hypothetical protein